MSMTKQRKTERKTQRKAIPPANGLDDDHAGDTDLGTPASLDPEKFRIALADFDWHDELALCGEWEIMRIAHALCVAGGHTPQGYDLSAIGKALEKLGPDWRKQGDQKKNTARNSNDRKQKIKERDTSRGGRVPAPARKAASELVQREARRLRLQAREDGKSLSDATTMKLAVKNVVASLKDVSHAQARTILNKKILLAIGETEAAQHAFAEAERVKFVRRDTKKFKGLRAAIEAAVSDPVDVDQSSTL